MKRMLALFLVLALCSCEKLIEKWQDAIKVPNDDCQIREVSFDRVIDGVPSKKTISFTYNDKGNPDWCEITYINPQGYDYGGEIYFSYDDQNRLISYENNTHTSTTYQYNGNERLPVSDITIHYYQPFYKENLFYDMKGRIIKVSGKFYEDYWNNEGAVQEYTLDFKYDERGNLVRDGYTYDSSRSILQTNSVWMLAARDWSVNNSIHATALNDHNLPVKFPRGDFFGHTDQNMSVLWQCK